MNFLKKGPELKLSGIKAPAFLEDIYLDLKERHLLPVAAILVVAIVAVPIVLSQSSDSAESISGGGAEASVVAEAETASQALVAKAMPGLRKYQKRLGYLRAKDPFKQLYTETESTSSETSPASGSGSESVTESPETSSPSTETSGAETVPSSETEGEPNPARLRYYSYAIDVRVSAGESPEGESQSGPASTPKSPADEPPREWTTRHNLPELTMLPSRETPAVIYMGSTKDAKKALMLVSSDVTSIFGDAKCVLGSKTCELLAMEPGLPETFVYGASGKTLKIELRKIHLVETKKLNRAPLGKPKQSGNGG